MTHPLIIFVAALITGNAAFSYAQAKGGSRTPLLFGALAFLVPVSLPLITLYLMGKKLPPGGHLRPPVVVLLTIGNVLAAVGIVALLAALSDG